MPKRKIPKVINREIIMALKVLTRNNLYISVKLSDIVDKVQLQINKQYVSLARNMTKEIKRSVYKLRDLGLIDHLGHDQFYLTDCLQSSEKADQKHLHNVKSKSNPLTPNLSKKSLPNYKSSLDPNRKNRNVNSSGGSSGGSGSSSSGCEIEKLQTLHYGTKELKTKGKNKAATGGQQKKKLKQSNKNTKIQKPQDQVSNGRKNRGVRGNSVFVESCEESEINL